MNRVAWCQECQSHGRARGSKRNARTFQAEGKQSELKILGSGSPPWKNFGATPFRLSLNAVTDILMKINGCSLLGFGMNNASYHYLTKDYLTKD